VDRRIAASLCFFCDGAYSWLYAGRQIGPLMHPTQIENRGDLANRMIVRHRLIETK
jgi:hypothetical protein